VLDIDIVTTGLTASDIRPI